MSYPIEELTLILEGILFAAGKPLTVEQLQKLFAKDEQPSLKELREALTQLAENYAERSVRLKEVATGFHFQVVERVAPWLYQLWEEKPARYTRATLETLALIAYRQPITRGQIEEVRGVAVSSQIIKNLMDREWIRVVGHKDVPGKPSLYATTKQFLEYFNLKNLDDLPPLADIQDLDKVTEELVEQEIEQQVDGIVAVEAEIRAHADECESHSEIVISDNELDSDADEHETSDAEHTLNESTASVNTDDTGNADFSRLLDKFEDTDDSDTPDVAEDIELNHDSVELDEMNEQNEIDDEVLETT